MIKKIIIALLLCAQSPLAAMHQQAATPQTEGGAAAAAAQQQAAPELIAECKLYDAINRDDVGEIEKLITADKSLANCDPDYEGSYPPLFYAAHCGKLKAVQKLIELGADIQSPNELHRELGITLLEVAIKGRNPALVEYVWNLEQTHGIRWAEAQRELTPLMSAALYGSIEVVQKLMKLGVNINARDLGGRTIMHYAAFGRDPELIDYLWNLGQLHWQREAQDNFGATPLQAGINGELSLTFPKYLLIHGSDLDRKLVLNLVSMKTLLTRMNGLGAEDPYDGNTGKQVNPYSKEYLAEYTTRDAEVVSYLSPPPSIDMEFARSLFSLPNTSKNYYLRALVLQALADLSRKYGTIEGKGYQDLAEELKEYRRDVFNSNVIMDIFLQKTKLLPVLVAIVTAYAYPHLSKQKENAL